MIPQTEEEMNIVIVGHVDHGKSTVIGRLLADTGSLPEGKLEQVREMCRRTARPFEYAFLLDALKDERAQGITIDSARCFFKTNRRRYIIIDAPGHIEFLKNMITGASRAEAALLVIDASEGVRENSRRHAYMLSMLGIKQVCVLVNKMDMVGFSREVFEKVAAECREFLSRIHVEPEGFIPVSAMRGDNIAFSGKENMPWYDGVTVLQMLDDFTVAPPPVKQPFRMPVQDVYKFTEENDSRRIIAGTVETGELHAGDEVIFYPSGKKTTVKRIEPMGGEGGEASAEAGRASGFTMDEQIFVKRGELCVKRGEPAPLVSNSMRVSLFWLGKEPMRMGKTYLIKTGTAKTECTLDSISGIMDASSLQKSAGDCIERYAVAECVISTSRLIAFDNIGELAATGRFVIIDGYEISGGGIFTDTAESRHKATRRGLELRDIKWESSSVTPVERERRYGQRCAIIIITGAKGTDKKVVAKALERSLFDDGRLVYYLGIGSVIYGVGADLNPSDAANRGNENIRRLAEIANILADAGAILILTATELSEYNVETIKIVASSKPIQTVWLGDPRNTDLECDMVLDPEQDCVGEIRRRLEQLGIIKAPGQA